MATYQTVYSESPAKGLPGQIANEEKHNQISRTPVNNIAFGAPAFRVAGAGNDHKCTATPGTGFLGIAVRTPAVGVRVGDAFIDGYAANTSETSVVTASLMTDGQIFVTAGASVVPGDDVYFITATGRYGTTSGAGATLIPGAYFDTTGADGDIVEISLKHRSA